MKELCCVQRFALQMFCFAKGFTYNSESAFRQMVYTDSYAPMDNVYVFSGLMLFAVSRIIFNDILFSNNWVNTYKIDH